MNNTLIDTPQAAVHLGGLQPNTLEGWRVKGQGPKHIKIGKLVRYRVADLDAWLDEQVRHSTSDSRKPTPEPPKVVSVKILSTSKGGV